MAHVLGEATVRELESDLAGKVIRPDDAEYETARSGLTTVSPAFLDTLPDAAIATYAEQHRRSADLPIQEELHIHHLGGAMGAVSPDATAFTERWSPFLINCIARTPEVDQLPAQIEWARAARDAMAAYGNGRTYVNFTGLGAGDKARMSYPPQTYARLQA